MKTTSENSKETIISKSQFTTGGVCRYATYQKIVNAHLAKAPDNEMVLVNGKEFGIEAAKFMGATYFVEYSEDKANMVNATKEAIDAGNKIIAEASFISEGKFCAVDVFKINENGTISIYEVKSGTEVKEGNEYDLAFQYTILKELGYNIEKAFLVHADGIYMFAKGETIDYEKLFVFNDFTENCENHVSFIKAEVEEIIKSINSKTPPEHDFCGFCNSPYPCPFFDACIAEAGLPKDTNIFNISGPRFTSTKLNKWYYNGIKTYEDIVEQVKVTYKKNGEPRDASWKYVQQAKAFLDKEDPPIEMEKLGEFLQKIKYPIGSFDYEGFATPIPMYYGLKSNKQVVFQFSYDFIEYEGAERKHFEFLAKPGEDPRKELCKALSKLPIANSILIWNETYERCRNQEMAELEGLEEYKDVLLKMVENFVDLMIPFKDRMIVPWRANGSYSLKPITENLIPNLQYYDLAVHNGTEAAEKFLKLPSMNKKEQNKTIHALKMYNNQDTYGPLKILEKLFRIYKQDESFVLFTDKSQKDVCGNELHVGDTVTSNRGIGSITKIGDKYISVMLMTSGEEIKRVGTSLVLIQEYVTDKPRNVVTVFPKELEINDLVTCNRGIGKVCGFTASFVRIKLFTGFEILRMRHNINRIQGFIDK